MGRLGGCEDLNLGIGVEPESRSVKEVVKVNPAAWSKLPVEDAMAKRISG